MEYRNIICERSDGFLTIILSRPDRLNAVSVGLRNDLERALDDIEKDDEIKVIVITGAHRKDGRPCFCAGADIKEMTEIGAIPTESAFGPGEEGLFKTLSCYGGAYDILQNTYNRIGHFLKPVIAAIDGICTAGGLEIALACDIRIAADTAQISDLHIKNLSLLGGGGLQTRLPVAVGLSKAKQIMWTGMPIDGKEAHRIGLVDEVFPSETMITEAKKMAKVISGMDILSLKMSKEVINNTIGHSTHDSLRYSAFCEALMRVMRPKYMDKLNHFANH